MTTPLKATLEDSIANIEMAIMHKTQKRNARWAFTLFKKSMRILQAIHPTVYSDLEERSIKGLP